VGDQTSGPVLGPPADAAVGHVEHGVARGAEIAELTARLDEVGVGARDDDADFGVMTTCLR
jgi:hypothetical protein